MLAPPKLSASKIKLLADCSFSYYCRYVLNCPDIPNSGSRRGSTVHDFMELVVKPKHANFLKALGELKDPGRHPVVRRFLQARGKKYGLDTTEMVKPLKKGGEFEHTMDVLCNMTTIALATGYFNQKGKTLIDSEVAFDITNENPPYRIVGYIDQAWTDNKTVEILDFKSSQKKFTGDEAKNNIQASIYSLAAKKLWPKFKKRIAKFLFLRFPKDPTLEHPEINNNALLGVEHYLAYISEYITNFKPENATDNMAKHNYGKKWLCGKPGAYECSYKYPFDYYVLIELKDGKDQVLESKFTNNFIPKENQRVEHRKHKGCPAWAKETEEAFF